MVNFSTTKTLTFPFKSGDIYTYFTFRRLYESCMIIKTAVTDRAVFLLNKVDEYLPYGHLWVLATPCLLAMALVLPVETTVFWLVLSGLLNSIQDKNTNNPNFIRFIRSIVLSAVMLVGFNATISVILYSSFGPMVDYIGFFLMAFLSQSSDIEEGGKYDYLKKGFWIAAIWVLGDCCIGQLYSIVKSLTVTTRWEYLLIETITYGALLSYIFIAQSIMGKDWSDLFGEKHYKISTFIRFFLLGAVTVVSIGLIFSFAASYLLPATRLILLSYNYIQWSAIDYIAFQALATIDMLMITLFEEILFRTILYKMLYLCGYGHKVLEKDQDAGEGYSYWYHIAVATMFMAACFSGVHMANPVETGQAFLSGVDKFLTYFSMFGLSLAYLLFENIAFSWGMHFAHNMGISLFRYGPQVSSNGFYAPNYYEDTSTLGSGIQSMVLRSFIMGAVVVGAYVFTKDEGKEAVQKVTLG